MKTLIKHPIEKEFAPITSLLDFKETIKYLVRQTTVEKLSGEMKFPWYHATSPDARLFISCVNPKSVKKNKGHNQLLKYVGTSQRIY